MKIVHCVGWYFPDYTGGSEVYVERLARDLQSLGHEVVVFAPRDGDAEDSYEHAGVRVVRYPVPLERTRAQHDGLVPPPRFELFERRLRELGADVMHLHSFTYGAGRHHLRAARSLGMRTVVTAHTPGLVCARGTMMLHGREPCDGRIEAHRCAACWLAARGAPRPLTRPLVALGRSLPQFARERAPGALRSVLSAPGRMLAARSVLLEFVGHADRAVAVCKWIADALRRNGVPPEKILLCRQGVAALPAAGDRGPLPDPRPRPPLRVGYFGRGAIEKGIDVLVRAVRALPPSISLELRVHAVVNSREDRDYMDEVRALARGEARIAFEAPLPADAVPRAMRNYDVIAVPSRCLETGPLVAMEALAAGVPVLGSDLGGLAELIEPGVTGWLLPAENVERWSAQLAALAAPGAAALRFDLDRLPLLTQREVARRMAALYTEIGSAGARDR